jgi:hypothetical protein
VGTPVSLALAALAGAAIATTLTFVLSAGRAERARPALTGEAPAPPASIAASDASALADLADRITALQMAVGELERKLDAVLSARERASPATDGEGVVIDAATLQRAIEGAQASAELAKLNAMKPAEVLSTAEELVNTRKDLGKARQLLEGLLARPLTPAERQKVLTELGIAHRGGGDFESSEAVLQQAVDLAGGTATEAGAWAGFQMAWTFQFADDAVSARRWFDQVANSSGGDARLRLEARWNAAKLAADAGDPNARAEFAAILRECGDDPALRHIADDVKARLGR